MSFEKKIIRCLVVDDSPTFRAVMREVLEHDAGIRVVGEAGDGIEAVEKTLKLKPDVITMDVQMPRRDGLMAIQQIMADCPTPMVVVAAGANEESLGIGFRALRLGAVEVLSKPDQADAQRFTKQAAAIRFAVRAFAGLTMAARGRGLSPPPKQGSPSVAAPVRLTTSRTRPPPSRSLRGVGIVTSTGGPAALAKIFEALPPSFPVPILVVQHIIDGFGWTLVRWLQTQCKLKVVTAVGGEILEGGTVYFAPDGQHLVVSAGRLRLDDGPPTKGFKPSGTVLLASLAREFGSEAAGLILTGMGDDGVLGLRVLRDRGGFTAAQGPNSSVIYGMPGAALGSGAASASWELDEIAPELMRLVG